MHNDISPGNVTVSMDPLGAGDSARFPLIDGGGATMHDPSMTVMSLDHYWLHYSTVVSLHYSSSQVGSNPSHVFTTCMLVCLYQML